MAIEKYTTECFVLESYERSEHDRVFKLFTRDFGLIMAHAKSIRKLESRLRAHILPGRCALVTLVKGREVWRLVGAQEHTTPLHFMPEVRTYISRFIKGEGAYKALYDRLMVFLERSFSFEENKARLLLLYMLLVALGYADAKMIGAKNVETYIAWSIDDLYTHLLLTYKEVRSHVQLVMKEMQI
jgi:recombinational DNA repair protein (RecF pathway)